MDQLRRFFEGITVKKDGDWTDRLSYQLSPYALVVVITCITGWSFVGDPIQCWYPATYTKYWQEYGDDICYVKGTYHIPMFEKTLNVSSVPSSMVPIPRDKNIKDELSVNYYQWVVFFLLLQAACFYLPVHIWRALCSHGNMNLDTILDVVSWRKNLMEDERETKTQTIALFITHKHSLRPSAGKYTFLCYLFTKCLFAMNAVLQFVAVKLFLGQKDYLWGWEITKSRWEGNDIETLVFPRNTLCEFAVNALGAVHNHTAQCFLTINILNEKIFLVIWWWLLFIFVASLTSLLQWIFDFFIPCRRIAMVTSFIATIDPKVTNEDIKKFVDDELRIDGAFLIELLITNEGEKPAADLLKAMWKNRQKNGVKKIAKD